MADKPQYAIYRHEKISGDAWQGSIGKLAAHVWRARPTPNADPDRPVVLLHGSWDLIADVEARMAQRSDPDKPLRKNGVRCIDHMITASPEYFRDPGQGPGEYNQERMEAWRDATLAWLRAEHGDNLVSVTLHLDESTPHIHAVTVPLVKGMYGKGKARREMLKMNARALYGGGEKMAQWQDRYAEAVAHLGLERGIPGSTAEHQSIKKYYAQLNTPVKLPALQKLAPVVLPEPTMGDRVDPKRYAEAAVKTALEAQTKLDRAAMEEAVAGITARASGYNAAVKARDADRATLKRP
jgi:hypothetical protein